MRAKRGVFQVEEAGGVPAYIFQTSKGRIAARITLDPVLYSGEVRARILRWFERRVLDPVDPPLRLLADETPVRLVQVPCEDPYGLESRE